ncbi:putative Complex 1 protein (LYR family) Complex1 LYR like [Trypanosoma vivax]|uniref:Succinate dehydrogenase assembly factor 3 n=1 Tax=Trypanosoma vivax (strain Y486) TaxID=1055687 RepID=G0UAV3_TRYVY|nr:hypothetical protein TRVL_00738 [Trypanosoma vivax]KAH8611881.1 putative Complex 1 protein (LYR family) Complex1 LYR like [Trypanosoma vivax]CCC52940.1 conserved hypothetical protein [Trypanosoma vivax Y486]
MQRCTKRLVSQPARDRFQSLGSSGLSGLASLPHPAQLDTLSFRSEAWRSAMCHLYRTLLKLHLARLQPVQREFGDRFVQTEFQRHTSMSEKHARIFYSKWYEYAAHLWMGQTSRDLTAEEQHQLTPDQKETLKQLRSHVVLARQNDPNFML